MLGNDAAQSPPARIDENFGAGGAFLNLPRMALLQRLPGCSALAGLLLLSAGCAQFQWSSGGPGAPGYRTPPPPLFTAAPRGDHPLPELPPAPPFSPSDRERIAELQPWVERIAAQRNMDPDLINGVIWVESRFQPRAQSSAGARGLMQLMPATANAMARELERPIARVYDPEFNIEAGSLYLLKLLDRYDGDETLALAAYNAGAGNVHKWMAHDGVLPPRSLQYVENVQRARMRFVAMRDERAGPGTREDDTMLAAAPTRAAAPPRAEAPPEVPPPPRSSARTTAPRGQQPVDPPARPRAPSPAVAPPEPAPASPRTDTPYPPVLDDPAPVRAKTPSEPPRRALPSVLD